MTGATMTRLIIAVTLVAISTTASAVTDYACLSDCMNKGTLYKNCMQECTYDNKPVQTPVIQGTPLPPPTVKALFTGRSESITTVDGLAARKCEYSLNGKIFWKIVEWACPSTIDVR